MAEIQRYQWKVEHLYELFQEASVEDMTELLTYVRSTSPGATVLLGDKVKAMMERYYGPTPADIQYQLDTEENEARYAKRRPRVRRLPWRRAEPPER